ncbi:MAG TPA: EAL domain-containing protein, partial [Thermomicrobiales bacterium]|nr:EAL domain-containing protein [Thermomicrobiales bacterium]
RYQPQVDLATGRIVRLDASAYWDRLDGGLFPPAPFVRAQGATADVAPTGWWVVREACRQVRMWRVIAGDGSPGVSVLLSIHEFCRATLADELAAALAAADIEPAALEVRIAESTAAIADREIVAQVRALGAVVAVADFGKRDVSLARLQRLEVDALFLDASIAAGLGRDRGGMLAARIASTVGHDLGLTIGANGVAMAQQADALRRIGVERGQGDAFGARLCPQTVATLLTGGATLVTRGVGAVSGPAPGR